MMNTTPKTVSCLLMTYNCAQTLPRTLKSIIAQDYPEIEIVIADGASTDGTVDVIRRCEAFLEEKTPDVEVSGSITSDAKPADTGADDGNKSHRRRTLVWRSEPDKGLYDALNKSVAMATGDYLIVANDLLAKRDALSRLVRALESGEYVGAHADLVYAEEGPAGADSALRGDVETGVGASQGNDVPHGAEKPAGPVIRRYWHMGNSHRLWTGWMPGHPALLLKREIYDQYGFYKTDYRIAADYEFMVRFLKDKENRLAYVPDVLVRMYYGGTSTARFSDYVDSFREGVRALRENKTALPVALFTTALRTVRVLLQFRQVFML